MAKFLPLQQAVAENLNDGDIVAFEGFTHLIPTAAAHEAIRQGFRDLTLIRMTPDLIYDQMIGMGMAKKMIFSYAGNPGVGLLRRLRDAVENGWPHPLEIEEHTHAAMANAYEAGAAGLPCAIFRGYSGAGLREVNPNIKSVTCPFTGEVLAAVPAVRPDVDLHPCAEGRPQGQRAGRGHRRRAEGGGAGGKARRGHGRGSRRRFRRPASQSLRPAALDGARRSRSCRAARIRPTRMATMSATTPPISNGTRSPPTATGSADWMQENVIEKSRRTISPAASRI